MMNIQRYNLRPRKGRPSTTPADIYRSSGESRKRQPPVSPNGYLYESPAKSIKQEPPSSEPPSLLNMEEDTLVVVASYLTFPEVYNLGCSSKHFHEIERAVGRKPKFMRDNPMSKYMRCLRGPASRTSVQHMRSLKPQAFDACTAAANEVGRSVIYASGGLVLQAVFQEDFKTDGDFYVHPCAVPPVRDNLVEKGFVLACAFANYKGCSPGLGPVMSEYIIHVETYILPSRDANYSPPATRPRPTIVYDGPDERCVIIKLSNGEDVPYNPHITDLPNRSVAERVDLIVTPRAKKVMRTFDLSCCCNALDMFNNGAPFCNDLVIGYPHLTLNRSVELIGHYQNKRIYAYMEFLLFDHDGVVFSKIMHVLQRCLPNQALLPSSYYTRIMGDIKDQHARGGVFSGVFDEPSFKAVVALRRARGRFYAVPPSKMYDIILYLVVKCLRKEVLGYALVRFCGRKHEAINNRDPLSGHINVVLRAYVRILKYVEDRKYTPKGKLGHLVGSSRNRKRLNEIMRPFSDMSASGSTNDLIDIFIRTERCTRTSSRKIGKMIEAMVAVVPHSDINSGICRSGESIVERYHRHALIDELVEMRELLMSRHQPLSPGYQGRLLLEPAEELVLQHQDAIVAGHPLSYYCELFHEEALRRHFTLAELMFLKLMYLHVEHAYASNVINSNRVLIEVDLRKASWERDLPRQDPVPTDWIRDMNAECANQIRPKSSIVQSFRKLRRALLGRNELSGAPTARSGEFEEAPPMVVSPEETSALRALDRI